VRRRVGWRHGNASKVGNFEHDPCEIDAPTGGIEAVMRRLPWRLLAAAIGLLALTLSAPAQRQKAPERQRPPEQVGSVTILTDGIAEPNSRVTRAINELAKDIDNVRVLPIAGHGAAANVRDLIQLRGVDLAVLNSDIFLFLDQTRQSPAARDHIRYVTHIYNQKVYLLARKEFNTIKDFRGRKLGVLSSGGGSHTTATTLFGLLNIDVALHALGTDASLDDATLERLDGVLLLSDELARVRLSAQARQDLRVLPIGLTPAMRSAYRSAVIEPQELPGFPIAANTETIAVSTLLAVYNWRPSQARFADVSKFSTGLFSALARLRQNSGSVWRQADISAQIEGWPRHSAAQPSRALGKAQPAPPALPEETTAAIPPAVEPSPVAADRPTKITVLAMGRAPLADEQLPGGGLIPELLRSSLGKARPSGAGSEIELRWTMAAPVKSLLSDTSIDISLPWDGADCERPNDLVQASAVLCDNALYSDPILDVVVGLFTRSDGNLTFDTDESIFGRTICISGDQDVSLLNGLGRSWLSQKRVTAVRQPTLLDCASAVQTQEVDAFVASDLEGRYVLDRLGLSGHFRMAQRPLGIRGVHAVASKEHAQAPELIAAVNRGLKQLKESGAYAAIIRSHLTRLWNAQAGTP
jgi:ABC-type amino acid transport substrate-binding protein